MICQKKLLIFNALKRIFLLLILSVYVGMIVWIVLCFRVVQFPIGLIVFKHLLIGQRLNVRIDWIGDGLRSYKLYRFYSMFPVFDCPGYFLVSRHSKNKFVIMSIRRTSPKTYRLCTNYVNFTASCCFNFFHSFRNLDELLSFICEYTRIVYGITPEKWAEIQKLF